MEGMELTNTNGRGQRLFFGVSFTLILGHLIHSLFKGLSAEYAALTISGVMTPLLITPFALWHGYLRYGIAKMTIFVVLVSLISWAYETLSISTGFPFGYYHYTSLLGIKIGTVPLSIMPAYFAYGYLAWSIAAALMSKRIRGIKGIDLFVLPFIASFVMVSWDVTMDPINSTITGMWNWHQGGAYFGVPFVNFLGWFLCVFTFYVTFALIDRSGGRARNSSVIDTKLYWMLPALMYVTAVVEYIAGMIGRKSVQVASMDGHVWWTGDIYGSMALVALFTMLFITVLTLSRLGMDFARTESTN